MFIYTVSYFYFKYSLGNFRNLLITSLFNYNSKAYTIKLGFLTKKKKIIKNFSIFSFQCFLISVSFFYLDVFWNTTDNFLIVGNIRLHKII